MLFAEDHAQLLLVAHAVLGAALVAASTHLVVWMRGFPRGAFARLRAVRRFAWIAASLFMVNLVLGNVIYPVYKVRVRAEYLDQGGAVVRDLDERREVRARVRARHDSERGELAPGGAGSEERQSERRSVPMQEDGPAVAEPGVPAEAAVLPRRAARIALWFDVKEHWVALGAALAIACCVVLQVWDPRKHGRALASIVFLMALGAALSAWLGAIVGVVVTSYRSIGGLG